MLSVWEDEPAKNKGKPKVYSLPTSGTLSNIFLMVVMPYVCCLVWFCELPSSAVKEETAWWLQRQFEECSYLVQIVHFSDMMIHTCHCLIPVSESGLFSECKLNSLMTSGMEFLCMSNHRGPSVNIIYDDNHFIFRYIFIVSSDALVLYGIRPFAFSLLSKSYWRLSAKL